MSWLVLFGAIVCEVAGTLTLNGVAVTAGQSISAADLVAGNLVFAPAAGAIGATYASFTFQVQDNGGTANGGLNTDATPRKLTVNVTSFNAAPVGTPTTVTMAKNTSFTFTQANFGFTDPDDVPGNFLLE